jgi:hypothetical protein
MKSITVLFCIVTFLLIFMVVIERRTRGILYNRQFYNQSIIPCTSLILESRRYTLFQVPPDVGRGTGIITIHCTGEIREHSNVSCILYGISDEPYKVFDYNHSDIFIVNERISFDVVQHHDMISMKIQTSNPGSGNVMSDIAVSLILTTCVDCL